MPFVGEDGNLLVGADGKPVSKSCLAYDSYFTVLIKVLKANKAVYDVDGIEAEEAFNA